MAGANSAFHGNLPHLACAIAASRMLPGTPTDLPPGNAWTNGSAVPSGPTKRCGVAAIGAASRPSMVETMPVRPSL